MGRPVLISVRRLTRSRSRAGAVLPGLHFVMPKSPTNWLPLIARTPARRGTGGPGTVAGLGPACGDRSWAEARFAARRRRREPDVPACWQGAAPRPRTWRTGAVVVDNRVDVLNAGVCQQIEAVQELDGQHIARSVAPHQECPIKVFMVGQVTRSDSVFIGSDLSITGVGSGVSFRDVGTYSIEDFNLLVFSDLELGMRQPDQGDVANTQVLDGPVHDGVEIFPTAQVAENRPHEVAAAGDSRPR